MSRYEINFKINGCIEIEAGSVEAARHEFKNLEDNTIYRHTNGIPIMVGFCILDEDEEITMYNK